MEGGSGATPADHGWQGRGVDASVLKRLVEARDDVLMLANAARVRAEWMEFGAFQLRRTASRLNFEHGATMAAAELARVECHAALDMIGFQPPPPPPPQ